MDSVGVWNGWDGLGDARKGSHGELWFVRVGYVVDR